MTWQTAESDGGCRSPRSRIQFSGATARCTRPPRQLFSHTQLFLVTQSGRRIAKHRTTYFSSSSSSLVFFVYVCASDLEDYVAEIALVSAVPLTRPSIRQIFLLQVAGLSPPILVVSLPLPCANPSALPRTASPDPACVRTPRPPVWHMHLPDPVHIRTSLSRKTPLMRRYLVQKKFHIDVDQ